MKIHTWAWLGWLAAGLTVILSTRNPFYLLFLAILFLLFQASISQNQKVLPLSTLRFAFTIFFFSTIFNALISRFGQTVLLTIPGQIALVGGNITLEAIVFGAINGLVLVNMFTLFTIINQVVPVKNLIRLIPQAFQPVALVTTIALTFIPATQRQFAAIKEAQKVRGQEIRRLRDWLPLFIPLLTGGLERALQIGEAMTARGYTVQASTNPKAGWQKILLPGALLCITGGFFLLLSSSSPWLGWSATGLGLACLLALFILSGRRFKKTHYFEEHWNTASIVILIAALFVILIFLLPLSQNQLLVYEPYPKISLPQFHFLHPGALLFLMIPLIWIHRGENDPF